MAIPNIGINVQRFLLLTVCCLHSLFYVPSVLANDVIVHQLDAKTVQSTVLDSNDHWLLLHYGADQNFDQFMEKIAKNVLNYGISFGKIDCAKEVKFCNAEGIRVMPTLKFITGKPQLNPYSGKMIRSTDVFTGGFLDPRSVNKFISQSYPISAVTTIVSDSELDSFKESNTDLPISILFSDKAAPSLVFRTIADHFKGRMSFVFVPMKSAAGVAERFKVTSTSIGVLESNSTIPIFFDGEDINLRSSVITWLSTFAADIAAAAPDIPSATREDLSADQVKQEYASSEFNIDTLPTGDAWMIAVLKEGADLPKQWVDAKKGCVGHIKATVLRCSSDDLTVTAEASASGDQVADIATLSFGQQACSKSGSSLPYLLLLRHGSAERKKLSSPKLKWDTIVMEVTSHEKALKKLGESLPSSSITGVYENMLPHFVAEGNNKGLATILLLSDGPTASTLFKNVALRYGEVIQFGLLSGPSPQLVKDANIAKLPAVLALMQPLDGTVNSNPEQGPGMRVINYDHRVLGPVRFESLCAFIEAIARESGVQGRRNDNKAEGDVKQDRQEELITIKNDVDWSTHCGESYRGICAIGLLSPSTGSTGDLQGADVIEGAMKELKSSRASFLFLAIDAVCHPEFLESFGVQSHELPTVVIYSPSKRRFQLLKGSFSQNSVKELASSVISGRSSTMPMSTTPVVSPDCAPSPLGDSGEAFLDTAESTEDAEEFLREIQREEAAKAAQLKQEIAEERLRLAKEEEEAKKKKSTKKKKKKSKKTKKTEL